MSEKDLRDRLRELRVEKNLTQMEAARLLEVSKAWVEKVEAKSSSPKGICLEGAIARLERFFSEGG